VDALLTDLRFAVRALISRPGFSVMAIVTLAIGIGVNAVTFSAINGLIYKPNRFPASESLGWITLQATGNPYGQVSWQEYLEIAQNAKSFDAITAEGRRPLGLRVGREVRQVWALCVSSNYLATLRVRPAIGRILTDRDATSSDLAVVVSDRFWKTHLGADSIAGKTITLNGRTAAVVGVLPDTFQGPGGLFEPDVWVPLDRIDLLGMSERLTSRDQPWLGMVGRLRSGVAMAQAAADLQRVTPMVETVGSGSGQANRDAQNARPRVLKYWPMLEGHPEARGIAPLAFRALGIVGLVLLLACFNVAGLLIARASDRQRETSVRAALGASRLRIVRQFALEGLLLAVVSGLAAILVAGWSADLLAVFSLPSPIPQRLHMSVDRSVIGFTAVLVALGGILPALLPAFQATRVDLLRSMRLEPPAGKRRAFARSTFIVLQIAGSTLLLTASLLFVRSFWTSSTTNPGFETDHLVVLELKPSDYGYDAVRSRAFFDDLLSRVKSSPGVARAAVADRIPFYVGFPKTTRVSIDGSDCAIVECRPTDVYGVGAGHFTALDVPLIAGRDFDDRDIGARDSAIVGQTMAARLWPGRDAVGQWIRLGATGRQLQVIGVAADVTHRMFNERPADYVYRAIEPDEFAETVTMIVRTNTDAAAFVGQLQEHIRGLDPALPPGAIKTMAQRMEMPLWPVRTAAGFFTICGLLALVLATVGLFGTTYLAVGQRTREFGIRAALGSTRARVLRLVLGEGLMLAVPGILAGIAGAALAARMVSSLIVTVDAADVSTYAMVALLQAMAAIGACLWPGHRATKADPILALRAE